MARGKIHQSSLALAAVFISLSSLYVGQQNLALLKGKNRPVVEEELSHYECPQQGYVYMHDRLIDGVESRTHNTSTSRFIPKKIHFIVQSRCIPQELAAQLQQIWQPAETSTKSR